MPSAADVRAAFQPEDAHGLWLGAGLDVKAAHKRVMVKATDRGLLLFRFQGRLYYYKVCHFGARFSAYWWQRVGGILLRLLHGFLAAQPHRLWLYVDDLLANLYRPASCNQFALMVACLTVLQVPISWKKAYLGDSLIWCGWKFNFRAETVELQAAKLEKLKQQLHGLRESRHVHRKDLESCLGLLMWATSLSTHLRAFTAPLYSDLHSPPGTMYSVPARLWQQLLFALSSKGVISKEVPALSLPLNARVIECQGRLVRCKADIPPVPSSAGVTWLRVADPDAQKIVLRNESKDAIHWILQCLAFCPAVPLRIPHLRASLAAADAMAEGETVGIGGWFALSEDFAWFSEVWSIKEVRAAWPFLTKEPQRYIACFETIAQLALAMMAKSCLGITGQRFAVPSGSDNVPTEAGLAKLFTTAWPLSHFLRLVAAWSHANAVTLQTSHKPGVKNGLADALSRDRLDAVLNRPQQRQRFGLHQFAACMGCIDFQPPEAPWDQSTSLKPFLPA